MGRLLFRKLLQTRQPRAATVLALAAKSSSNAPNSSRDLEGAAGAVLGGDEG